MAAISPKPEEWDAKKAKMIDWMTRYEAIVEKVQPLKERRNREVMDATEDRAEDMGMTVEDMFEDWEKNDKEFFMEAEHAQMEMEERLKTQGTVAKVEKLGQEIDATLKAAHQGMLKIKSNMQMRKRIFTQALFQHPSAESVDKAEKGMYEEEAEFNEWAMEEEAAFDEWETEMEHADMPKASEELKKMPDGQKVKKVFDTVTDWVKEAEAIHAKAEPAAKRRERALHVATEDRAEEVKGILMDADKDYKESDEEFYEDVMKAQHDFEMELEEVGVMEQDRKLKKDIKDQFDAWGKGMKRVRSSVSLSAQQNVVVMRNLKALEGDIDSILATL